MQDHGDQDEQVPVLERSVADLNIGNRALNVFRKYGIKTVADLVEYEVDDLRDLRSFGPYCLAETLSALEEVGLKLKPANYAARR